MKTQFSLPPTVTRAFDELCQQADKSTGINQPRDFERFCRFAVVAHGEHVHIGEEVLKEKFKSHGWSEEHADAAAKRFKAARTLLEIYDNYKSGSGLL